MDRPSKWNGAIAPSQTFDAGPWKCLSKLARKVDPSEAPSSPAPKKRSLYRCDDAGDSDDAETGTATGRVNEHWAQYWAIIEKRISRYRESQTHTSSFDYVMSRFVGVWICNKLRLALDYLRLLPLQVTLTSKTISTFNSIIYKHRHVRSTARKTIEEITITATTQKPVLESLSSGGWIWISSNPP